MESEVTYKPDGQSNLRPLPDRFSAIDGLVLSGSINDVGARLSPVSGFYPEAGASLRAVTPMRDLSPVDSEAPARIDTELDLVPVVP